MDSRDLASSMQGTCAMGFLLNWHLSSSSDNMGGFPLELQLGLGTSSRDLCNGFPLTGTCPLHRATWEDLYWNCNWDLGILLKGLVQWISFDWHLSSSLGNMGWRIHTGTEGHPPQADCQQSRARLLPLPCTAIRGCRGD